MFPSSAVEAMSTMANQLTEARETAAMYGMEMPPPHEAERRPSVRAHPWRRRWILEGRKMGKMWKNDLRLMGWWLMLIFFRSIYRILWGYTGISHFQTPICCFRVQFAAVSDFRFHFLGDSGDSCVETRDAQETFPGSSAKSCDNGSPGRGALWLWEIGQQNGEFNGIFFDFFDILGWKFRICVVFLSVTWSDQWFLMILGLFQRLESPHILWLYDHFHHLIANMSWGPWYPARLGPIGDADIRPPEILCGRCPPGKAMGSFGGMALGLPHCNRFIIIHYTQ